MQPPCRETKTVTSITMISAWAKEVMEEALREQRPFPHIIEDPPNSRPYERAFRGDVANFRDWMTTVTTMMMAMGFAEMLLVITLIIITIMIMVIALLRDDGRLISRLVLRQILLPEFLHSNIV